jgi:RNA polymerase sigma factor (sigma-70 family)
MRQQSLSVVVRHLHRLASRGEMAEVSDVQLLERFVGERHEPAFIALLNRHGAMVFGVCQRILTQTQDAEDAFQATFLALVQKARSVGKRGTVSGWLYRVAYRIAMKARVSRVRRTTREREAGANHFSQPEAESVWQEIRPLLDEELHQLPEKYRLPIILCYLEGKTYTEAARALGWTKGTVSGRLALARNLLRERLIRRGLVLTPSLFGTLISRGTAGAAVPANLSARTVQAALLLMKGHALAGVASLRVATLLKAASQTAIGPLKLGIISALLVSLSAAGAGYMTLQANQNETKTSPSTESSVTFLNETPSVNSIRKERAKAPKPLVAPFTAGEAQAAQEAWAKYLGKKVEEEITLRGGSLKMVFVLIPPGTFKMGSPDEELMLKDDDKAFPDETPQHNVSITKPFYLGKFHVTQAEYVQLTGKKNPSFHNGDVAQEDRSRFPVDSVNWADADASRAALEKYLGSSWTKARMPSEAMWEYACRAGTETRWNVGNHLTDADASFGLRAGHFRMPWAVGNGRPNAFGLYDMHGNVCQWCSDRYGKYSGGDQTDPEGPEKGSARTFRGGSYYAPARLCRSAARGNIANLRPRDSSARNWNMGFRLAIIPNSSGK